MEPPAVKESHPTVEDGKVSSNGVSTATSTEKEDSKTDKTAAAEQTVEPEATGSNGKAELAKNPPVSPAKKAKDVHTNEPSGTNADSPRAADSIRYKFHLSFHFT